ncbi:BolA domain UV induced protein Uvi31 [Mucor velutinosus]|uniref:BolA domain UV induced protein Uvi31 n=1 Tax=Mucor velutinosus TaxID=708070 RepID=A0AAN7D4T1_9FUNG|nr:BolA domain UV induced protein Uvi31 [Mucor velutinosus]
MNYTYSDVHVHGAAFLPDDANTDNIQQLDEACPVANDRGTDLMDFRLVQMNAILASIQFHLMEPTLHLSSDGTLTKIGYSSTGFGVITFGTCKTCSYADTFSSPDAIYYGIGNWNGPIGMSWSERLIINLPVVKNTTITIQGNQPSLGMRVCSMLLNFYPSNETGGYIPGIFQVDRTTGGRIGGFFLMPKGSGIEIQDYQATGGSCLTTDICIPVFLDDAFIGDPGIVDPGNSSTEIGSEESDSSEEGSGFDSSNSEESGSEETSNSEESSIQENGSSTESSSSQSQSEEHILSSTEGSESSSSEKSSNGPNNNIEQNNSAINSQANSSNADQMPSSDSSGNYIGSTSGHFFPTSETSLNLDSSSAQTPESSDISGNSNPSNTNASKGKSVNNAPMPTRGPTETGIKCHTHHHHVTTTQYQCDQGFIHDEEILACEYDNHHHHRKDYYAGDDVEFGLYDYNRFDEECDIGHGIVNYDEDNYKCYYYKYKGKKHHGDHDDDDGEEDEDEDEDDEDDEGDNEENEAGNEDDE